MVFIALDQNKIINANEIEHINNTKGYKFKCLDPACIYDLILVNGTKKRRRHFRHLYKGKKKCWAQKDYDARENDYNNKDYMIS